MWNCFPCSTWSLMSSIATQIHMAGRTCTSVNRQLVKRSLSPWKSMRKAPTIMASGASQRRERLKERTASSTAFSSLDWTSLTNLATVPSARSWGFAGGAVGPEPSAAASPSGDPGPSGGTTAAGGAPSAPLWPS